MRIKQQWNYLGRVFGLLSISAALSACAWQYADVPSIAGSPMLVIAINNPYRFQPWTDGHAVSFGIDHKPRWADFDPTTGVLSGVPGAGDAGEYPNIVISASDGTSTATLRNFTIEVNAPALNAPAIAASSSTRKAGVTI